jgi:hypothetical protein
LREGLQWSSFFIPFFLRDKKKRERKARPEPDSHRGDEGHAQIKFSVLTNLLKYYCCKLLRQKTKQLIPYKNCFLKNQKAAVIVIKKN